MKALLLLALLLTSCSSSDKTKNDQGPKKTNAPDRVIIGRIASVSKTSKLGKFVLIQKLGKGKLPEGIIYQSQGPNGRAASLRPSGERVRDFFAADLLSGEVAQGDAVIAYQNIKTKQAEAEAEAKTETKAEAKADVPKKAPNPESKSDLPTDHQDA